MCHQCEIDGDHGQPCPIIEAEIDKWEMAARNGEEALEAFYAAPKGTPSATWPVTVDSDAPIPF